ncbi:unnamed protein product [Pieris macdunnoughi]|uniref:Uncharacterized protein n=1 Tax=Pieris macdunnoughi TaxID=345717 RepID=A0A821LKM9_9NEOP|nr:unnamed protein product [Pieris macdunnoughi]
MPCSLISGGFKKDNLFLVKAAAHCYVGNNWPLFVIVNGEKRLYNKNIDGDICEFSYCNRCNYFFSPRRVKHNCEVYLRNGGKTSWGRINTEVTNNNFEDEGPSSFRTTSPYKVIVEKIFVTEERNFDVFIETHCKKECYTDKKKLRNEDRPRSLLLCDPSVIELNQHDEKHYFTIKKVYHEHDGNLYLYSKDIIHEDKENQATEEPLRDEVDAPVS